MTESKLNTLLNIPFEQWPKHGVKLGAVSANANGKVNSGICRDGTYFYRVYEKDGNERFKVEK